MTALPHIAPFAIKIGIGYVVKDARNLLIPTNRSIDSDLTGPLIPI
jgi:hypothetical protein